MKDKIIESLRVFAKENKDLFVQLFRDNLIHGDILNHKECLELTEFEVRRIYGKEYFNSRLYIQFIIGVATIKIVKFNQSYNGAFICDYERKEILIGEESYFVKRMIEFCRASNTIEAIDGSIKVYLSSITEFIIYMLALQTDNMELVLTDFYIRSHLNSIVSDIVLEIGLEVNKIIESEVNVNV